MEKTVVDNVGWGFAVTVFGVLTASHWVAQYATSLFTLVSCIIVAHFLKRYLNEHHGPNKPKNEDD